MAQYSVFEQKEQWEEFRIGYFTASEIYRLMTEPKKKGEVLSVGAKTYVAERAAEVLAPREPSYYNSAMEHGNDTEPAAVLRIAKELGLDVNDDNFIYTSLGGFVFFHDDELSLGGTPDVIIRPKMICEVKCPLSKTHLEYLMITEQEQVKSQLAKYYGQMQLNMHLTDTDKCLFVSYDDRFYDEKHHYHEVVIDRDSDYIERLLDKAYHANEYKKLILKTLKS